LQNAGQRLAVLDDGDAHAPGVAAGEKPARPVDRINNEGPPRIEPLRRILRFFR
jgi:hypothetical protein